MSRDAAGPRTPRPPPRAALTLSPPGGFQHVTRGHRPALPSLSEGGRASKRKEKEKGREKEEGRCSSHVTLGSPESFEEEPGAAIFLQLPVPLTLPGSS